MSGRRGVGPIVIALVVVWGCARFTAEEPAEAGAGDAGRADGAAGVDSAPLTDAGLVQAPCPNGVSCDGTCIDRSDCTTCSDAPLLCRVTGVCVRKCAECAVAAAECWTCDKDQKNPVGSCEPPPAFCLAGAASYPPGTTHCDCDNTDVKNCPGASQVCVPRGSSDDCVTCGEVGYATSGLRCRDGKVCDPLSTPPRCK